MSKSKKPLAAPFGVSEDYLIRTGDSPGPKKRRSHERKRKTRLAQTHLDFRKLRDRLDAEEMVGVKTPEGLDRRNRKMAPAFGTGGRRGGGRPKTGIRPRRERREEARDRLLPKDRVCPCCGSCVLERHRWSIRRTSRDWPRGLAENGMEWDRARTVCSGCLRRAKNAERRLRLEASLARKIIDGEG